MEAGYWLAGIHKKTQTQERGGHGTGKQRRGRAARHTGGLRNTGGKYGLVLNKHKD